MNWIALKKIVEIRDDQLLIKADWNGYEVYDIIRTQDPMTIRMLKIILDKQYEKGELEYGEEII